MRFTALLTLFFLVVWGFAGSGANADVSLGLSVEDGSLKSFYLAIGDHYRVPEKQIIVLREKKIHDDEMPVVFYLAAKAAVAPHLIVDLRLGGATWLEITTRYGLGTDIFYVNISDASGPPYGKGYGHYRNRHRKEWKNLRLSDAEIVNLVNLKFISDHYGYSPDEVVKMREQGQSFIAINDRVKKAKSEKKASGKEDDKDTKKDNGGKKGKGK